MDRSAPVPCRASRPRRSCLMMTQQVSRTTSHIGGAGSSTYLDSYGVFHSDFLWCNLQPGQDFVLTNRNTSYNDGRYAGTY